MCSSSEFCLILQGVCDCYQILQCFFLKVFFPLPFSKSDCVAFRNGQGGFINWSGSQDDLMAIIMK